MNRLLSGTAEIQTLGEYVSILCEYMKLYVLTPSQYESLQKDMSSAAHKIEEESKLRFTQGWREQEPTEAQLKAIVNMEGVLKWGTLIPKTKGDAADIISKMKTAMLERPKATIISNTLYTIKDDSNKHAVDMGSLELDDLPF